MEEVTEEREYSITAFDVGNSLTTQQIKDYNNRYLKNPDVLFHHLNEAQMNGFMDGLWTKIQTLIIRFGSFIAMEGEHLAVSTAAYNVGGIYEAVVFTYHLDHTTGTSVNSLIRTHCKDTLVSCQHIILVLFIEFAQYLW